ncbi:hypothetical protein [Macrococcoides caseolyticum]|nr:hypothetical protein [Macrococcus caseolyticus]
MKKLNEKQMKNINAGNPVLFALGGIVAADAMAHIDEITHGFKKGWNGK